MLILLFCYIAISGFIVPFSIICNNCKMKRLIILLQIMLLEFIDPPAITAIEVIEVCTNDLLYHGLLLVMKKDYLIQ